MNSSDFDIHVDSMLKDGYTVLHRMLTEYECDAARVELEQLAEHSEQGGLECLFNKARVFERV